jgi:hypothetical protein
MRENIFATKKDFDGYMCEASALYARVQQQRLIKKCFMTHGKYTPESRPGILDHSSLFWYDVTMEM